MPNDYRTAFRARLTRARLLAILRDAPDHALPELSRCLVDTGIRFVEVALNTPGALGQISLLRSLLPEAVEVGAGTVLERAQAQAALAAGATFLVSPCLSPEVQDLARELEIPTLPGAFTPGEVWQAHRSGAAMVKLFPARSAGGPAYIKELRGPFRDVPLLACGGISAQTARDHLDAGAQALAFGGSVFAPARLAAGDFAVVRRDLEALAEAVR
jgi:2-dehydro-3-deoxyphosphogluconate aldolase/(4S)-4-hydroxy-2-oxoglutarate aldolase